MSEETLPSDVAAIPRITHEEAMQITAEENRRFLALLRQLGPDDWPQPTDCTRWTVRDVAVHVTAAAEAQASFLEMLRQVRKGRRLTAEIGGKHWVDGVNEAQLRMRRAVTPASLPSRWEAASEASLGARRRMPARVRALRLLPLGSVDGLDGGWQPLGYLFDIGFTRDVWMHRVDICRATGRSMDPTRDHDGRIVEDIMAEWATSHTDPFHLELTGPAGGTFIRGAGSGVDPLEIDAIDACRILSGRGTATGVLRHPLPL